MRLIWTPVAVADLDRFRAFLGTKDDSAARRVVTAIRDGVRPLEANPHIGRPVPGFEPSYRERVVRVGRSAYVVRYRIDAAHVLILAVRHEREAGYRI
ncbi:MAG: type II toxin-antitoxin system RelE/ParE family toxin [Alphaproteobacteria bacterium]|nr:type II toxin-antitoxin system RelE/ParE family toxin [Alphaproteobacteria bacterium]